VDRAGFASRAGDIDVLEISFDRVALEIFRVFDDVGGVGADFLHEASAVESTAFHLLQFEFPLTDGR
jgi:hypothetical protein